MKSGQRTLSISKSPLYRFLNFSYSKFLIRFGLVEIELLLYLSNILMFLLLGEDEDDFAILVALELGTTRATLKELKALAKN